MPKNKQIKKRYFYLTKKTGITADMVKFSVYLALMEGVVSVKSFVAVILQDRRI